MTPGRRYRAIALHGDTLGMRGNPVHPDQRAHGIQVGGCGGRIIGQSWSLDRQRAEDIAVELDRAHREGSDGHDHG